MPPAGDFPNQGTEPESLTSPALAGEFFTTSTTWEALELYFKGNKLDTVSVQKYRLAFPLLLKLYIVT